MCRGLTLHVQGAAAVQRAVACVCESPPMRLLLQLLTGGVAATLGDTAPEPGHVVTSLDGATKLTLGPAGGLTSLSIRGVALQLLPAGSGVWLDGALASGHGAAASPIVGGGVAFTRELTFGAKKQHTAEVVEKFMPAESGAVEWSPGPTLHTVG